MEMYRTANPGMTVRPRPWPRGVVSSAELESIKWHSIRVGLLEIHRQPYQQDEKELFTLRFNRMNSVRVEYYYGRSMCHLNSNLSDLQSFFVQPNKMLDQSQADTTELVEEKETPATKAPKSGDRRTARLPRTRLKRRRSPSKLTTLP